MPGQIAPIINGCFKSGLTAPTPVCYGWGADPEVNLYNSADLPTSPFLTNLSSLP